MKCILCGVALRHTDKNWQSKSQLRWQEKIKMDMPYRTTKSPQQYRVNKLYFLNSDKLFIFILSQLPDVLKRAPNSNSLRQLPPDSLLRTKYIFLSPRPVSVCVCSPLPLFQTSLRLSVRQFEPVLACLAKEQSYFQLSQSTSKQWLELGISGG